MRRYIFLAPLLLAATQIYASEPDWDKLDAAEKKALECASEASFEPLFSLSASYEFSGADPAEELSEANENVFLRCPVEFLEALKVQPPETQKRLIRFYFGVRHEPWELGAILTKLKDHPSVGSLVSKEFKGYLQAKAPWEK